MNSLTAMRITVGSLAALLTGAVAYGVHAKDEASAARTVTVPGATDASQDPGSAQQLVVPAVGGDWGDDDEWDDEGRDGDDDDGAGWRLVIPDQSGGAVQPAPSQVPQSRAS